MKHRPCADCIRRMPTAYAVCRLTCKLRICQFIMYHDLDTRSSRHFLGIISSLLMTCYIKQLLKYFDFSSCLRVRHVGRRMLSILCRRILSIFLSFALLFLLVFLLPFLVHSRSILVLRILFSCVALFLLFKLFGEVDGFLCLCHHHASHTCVRSNWLISTHTPTMQMHTRTHTHLPSTDTL